jgi:UDP-N-acetylglucosamine 2-epimerase (non-hydrolysing)
LKRIAIALGTRPEIIKLAGLVRILKRKKGVRTFLVFTGQHYDFNMCQVFMRELQLPKLDVNLGIGGREKEAVGRMLLALSKFFREKKIDIAVAEGDTYSVLAAALASFQSNIMFAHVEAGLRSFDRRMPEETSRIVADDLAYYAFAPTRTALKHLEKSSARKEGIFLTGNTIVEAVERNLKTAAKSRILEKLGLEKDRYAVLTAHRQEYVDRKGTLTELLEALPRIKIKIVFPIHPRTEKMLKKFGLLEKLRSIENVALTEPIGYFDFLQLASNSLFLLSDSGGIQEEASVLKKFVVVLRDSTERPEILGKFGELTGYNAEKIVRAANRVVENSGKIRRRLKRLKCPFGDGKASQRIARILAVGK